jgi:hypothetical protein
MSEQTERRKQQYERFKGLFAIARQRYLDAGGDPRRSSGGLGGNDYLTEEERQELFTLGRLLGDVQIVGNEVHCQGRSWTIPVESEKKQDGTKCES